MTRQQVLSRRLQLARECDQQYRTAKQPNIPLMRKVWEHISDHPDEWFQAVWAMPRADLQTQASFRVLRDDNYSDDYSRFTTEQALANPCETAYCFAGHAVAMTEGVVHGLPVSGREFLVAGADHLGLGSHVADVLFGATNSMDDLRFILTEIFEREGETL